jgi:phosphatidylglycerol lysyltransferase
VFYQVHPGSLSLYLDVGLTAFKLGESGRVALGTFGLEGGARRGLRSQHKRALRDGLQFEVVTREQAASMLEQFERISDDWLETKSAREKSFSLGAFRRPYIEKFPYAVIRRHGEVVAFANVLAAAGLEELTIDLMRYSQAAPPGVMDFLFIELMLWGHERGYAWFNLGMAPLSGLENHELAPLWNRLGSLVFRHGEHFYNFQGLRDYKSKYDPVWEPRYLAMRGGLGVPGTLIDVATLISGGVAGLVSR